MAVLPLTEDAEKPRAAGGRLSEKGCAWEGKACIVWLLQEAGRGYLGSSARDTGVFVILGLKKCQSVS